MESILLKNLLITGAVGALGWMLGKAYLAVRKRRQADPSSQPRTPWWRKRKVVIGLLAAWCVVAGYLVVMSVIALFSGEWIPIMWTPLLFAAGLVFLIGLLRKTEEPEKSPASSQGA